MIILCNPKVILSCIYTSLKWIALDVTGAIKVYDTWLSLVHYQVLVK